MGGIKGHQASLASFCRLWIVLLGQNVNLCLNPNRLKTKELTKKHDTGSKKYIIKCIPSVNVHIFRVISLEHFTITLRKNRKIMGGVCLEWKKKTNRAGRGVPAKRNGWPSCL